MANVIQKYAKLITCFQKNFKKLPAIYLIPWLLAGRSGDKNHLSSQQESCKRALKKT